MVTTYKISKKLSTKHLKVDLFKDTREYYLLKIECKNDCFWLEKKIYLSTKLNYKQLVKEINKVKRDFRSKNGSIR